MLIDRTHRTWAFSSIVILAIATAVYVLYAESSSKGPTGGSLIGLLFGVIGTAMMLFAGLLAGRKQVPFWRIGSAQFWLRGHLWLGALSLPMILFHSGFGLGGRLEQVLWAFFAVVIASGFFGLLMQHFLPKLMTSRISRETFHVQVPYLQKRNRLLADADVAGQCERIPIGGDPLEEQLNRLARHADNVRTLEAQAGSREDKEQVRIQKAKWLDHVATDDRGLFLDLARHAKQSGWVRTENDLPSHLLKVYDFPGIAAEPPAAHKVKDAPPKKASPLAQLRSKSEPAGGGAQKPDGEAAESSGAAATGEKPAPSPLEQLKRGAAKKKGPGDSQVKKPASPLDQIRSQAGSEKPKSGKSPLDQIRSQAGKKKSQAGKSPLDQIRAQAGGKASGSGTQAPSGVKPASSSRVVEKRAAMKATQKRVAIADHPAAREIRKLLLDGYGYSEQLAAEIADSVRPFVSAADSENDESRPAADDDNRTSQQSTAVVRLLIDRYGYDKSIAQAAADQLQVVLDGGVTKGSSGKQQSSGSVLQRAAAEPGESDQSVSPLEQLKRKAAARKSTSKAKTGGTSPLDQLRASKPGGKAGPKPAGGGASSDRKKSTPARTSVSKPEAAPMAPLRTTELHDFYVRSVRPFLAGDGRAGRLSSATESVRAFSQMRATLPVELHETLSTLQTCCEEQRQFADQQRIHRWLHCWLALHIPFSVALFVLIAAHVVMSLRVIPWEFPIRL